MGQEDNKDVQGAAQGTDGVAQGTQGTDGAQGSAQGTQGTQVAIDYDKIQKMLDGTLAAKEKTALTAYFKQQGLSEEEVGEAIKAYKAERASKTPDINGLTAQVQAANDKVVKAEAHARQADIQLAAYGMADELGVSIQTMGYMLRLADLSGAMDDKGAVKTDTLKAALEKVLTDLPQLKPSAETSTGFRPSVGAHGGAQGGQAEQPKAKGVPTKRWNRFNQ